MAFRWFHKFFRDAHLERLQNTRHASTYQHEVLAAQGQQHGNTVGNAVAGGHDAFGLARSLQHLLKHAHHTGDAELTAEVQRTLQLYGFSARSQPAPEPALPASTPADQPDAADTKSAARLALGLYEEAMRQAPQQSAAAWASRNSITVLPSGMISSSTGSISADQALELKSLMCASAKEGDMAAVQQMWQMWEQKQHQQPPEQQLEVMCGYTTALVRMCAYYPKYRAQAAQQVQACLQRMQQVYATCSSDDTTSSSGTLASSTYSDSDADAEDGSSSLDAPPPTHTSSSASPSAAAAESSFRRASSPSGLLAKSFNHALKLQLQLGQHQQLRSTLADMHACGLRPRPGTYEILLTSAVVQQQPPGVCEELVHEMMGFGMLPGKGHFDQLLVSYARFGLVSEARRGLGRMLALGLAPATRHYNHVLQACAYARDLTAAQEMYEEMRAGGLQPDQRTYDRLFCAVRLSAERRRMEAARELNALARDDWQLRRAVLNKRAAHFNAAYSMLTEWQQHMVAAGVQHTERSLWHLMKALERLSRLQDCLQLAKQYEKLRPGNHKPHTHAIRVAARDARPEKLVEGMQLVQKLEQRQGRLSPQQQLVLLSAQAWVHQDVGKVAAAVARLRASGLRMDQSAYKSLVQIYCRLGQWSQASGLVREMLHKGLAPQEALWHICFRHLVWADAAATVVAEFLSLMEPHERHRFEQLYKLQSGRAEVQEAERQQQQALREQQQRADEGPVAQAAAEAYA